MLIDEVELASVIASLTGYVPTDPGALRPSPELVKWSNLTRRKFEVVIAVLASVFLYRYDIP